MFLILAIIFVSLTQEIKLVVGLRQPILLNGWATCPEKTEAGEQTPTLYLTRQWKSRTIEQAPEKFASVDRARKEAYVSSRMMLTFTCASDTRPVEIVVASKLIGAVLDYQLAKSSNHFNNVTCHLAVAHVESVREATGLYTCRNANNPALNDTIYLYSTGGKPPYLLLARSMYQPKLEKATEMNNLLKLTIHQNSNQTYTIPCQVTDPNVVVELHVKWSLKDNFQPVTTIPSYNPKSGFVIRSSYFDENVGNDTIFRCTTPLNDTHHFVDVSVVVLKQQENIYVANTSALEQFANSSQIKFHMGIPSRRFNKPEVYCFSNQPALSVDMEVTGNCKNLLECDILGKCLYQNLVSKETCPCTTKTATCSEGKQFDVWERRGRTNQRLTSNHSCLTTAIHKDAGIIKCRAVLPASKQIVTETILKYFIGLHGSVVTNWRLADATELIRTELTDKRNFKMPDFYHGDIVHVRCIATQFVFAKQFKVTIIRGYKGNEFPAEAYANSWSKPHENAIVQDYSLVLNYGDISEIRCYAPIWNEPNIYIHGDNAHITTRDSFPPEIDRSLQKNFMVYNYEQAQSVLCEGSGTPTPSLEWQFLLNNESMGFFRNDDTDEDDSILGITVEVTDGTFGNRAISSITLGNFSSSQIESSFGETPIILKCIAENVAGTDKQDYSFYVFNAVSPSFINSTNLTILVLSDETNIQLGCEAYGKPNPVLSWLKNGVEFNFEEFLQQENSSVSANNTDVVDTNGVKSTLVLPDVSYIGGNGTIFTCMATNSRSFTSKSFTIFVEDILQEESLLKEYLWLWIALLVFAAAVVFVAAVALYLKTKPVLTTEEVNAFLDGSDTMMDYALPALPFDKAFSLSKDCVQICRSEILGMGQFGLVCKATWTQSFTEYEKESKPEIVVKLPRKDAENYKEILKSFLSEIKILAFVGQHPNILKMFGAYVQELKKGAVYIVTEYCAGGNLLVYLRNLESRYKKIDIENAALCNEKERQGFQYELLRFAEEIARGMLFISEKNVIHGDLSARNVLLDEYKCVKLSDFGLSRKLSQYEKYIKKSDGPLPWRWMALESLKLLEFSTKSDVWAYGVCLWEIFSLGEIPYGAQSWNSDFITNITNGLRLEQPMYADAKTYEIMKNCWELEAQARPDFAELTDEFQFLRSYEYEKIM